MTPVLSRIFAPERFEQIDRSVAGIVQRRMLRYALAGVFIWSGLLKRLGMSPEGLPAQTAGALVPLLIPPDVARAQSPYGLMVGSPVQPRIWHAACSPHSR